MKAVLINLGCKVNKYELDCVATILKDNQVEVTYNHEFADLYVVNTCAVTNESEKKSRQYIAKIVKLNPDAKIVVMGCASQNNLDQFRKYDNVYSGIGLENKEYILDLINDKIFCLYDIEKEYKSISNPTIENTRAYLKVQDGCNNFCTYCIIPYLRGRSRSRNICDVVKEAKKFSESVKEIVVIGIDLSSYEIDCKPALHTLMYSLKDLDVRLRIGSLEVHVITKEFLETLSKIPNFCPQFHLSMQSGSNSILKKMNRKYTKEEYLERCNLIREYFPNCNITTDIIVGFSNETMDEFNETIETVRKANFGNIHIFPYSPRKGTVAYKFENITNEERHRRVDLLEIVRDELKNKYIKECKNYIYTLLTEEYINEYVTGYTENYIKAYLKNENYEINQLIKVKIIKQYLDGVLVEKV